MGNQVTEFKINGLKELIDQIQSLPEKVQEQMERKVLRTAAKRVLAAAQAKVPVKSGKLKNTLRIRVKVDKRKGELVAQVYAKDFHVHLIEFGHLHIGHAPKKKIIGVVAARPYIRPAAAENAESFIKESGEEFANQLERHLRKNK